MNFELAQIARAVGGRLSTTAAGSARVQGISTDSRTVQAGELFVALRGPNFDGHAFIAAAAMRGAVAALCEQADPAIAIPQIEVADSLFALGELAHVWRRQFDLPVVAVTGSSGKTTTKEMLGSILARSGAGLKTSGNLNNLIGLPQTLFQLKREDRWAVLEMGMSARGEIARLAEIAAPQIGIITNVGAAHLETLHGLDGVARAKGELFAALPAGGTAVINADDSRVAQLPVANGVRCLRFGLKGQGEIQARQVQVAGTTVRFELILPDGQQTVSLAVAGRHNVANALAAATAAVALGIPSAQIVAGLEDFRPVTGRMDCYRLENGVLLIEDTYNANPLSMRAALTALDEMGGEGRRIAVLGDMLELGPTSAELHRELGREAAQRVDQLLLLGAQAETVADGARAGGLTDDQVVVLTNHEAAGAFLLETLRSGDRVLVKGSRGMRMERVSAILRPAGAVMPGH